MSRIKNVMITEATKNYRYWLKKYYEEGLVVPRTKSEEYRQNKITIGEELANQYPIAKSTQKEFYKHLSYYKNGKK